MAVSPGIEPVVGSFPASSRRQFLQGAAGVLAFPYIVPGSALGKDGATAASERITVGVIGTGNRGTDDMMGMMRSPLSQVVAVCDCRRPRLEAAGKRVEQFYSERDNHGSYGGCKAYHDFREVIDRKDVDALIVTVPDHWHGIVATQALAAGKDLYCEKPLGRTIAESVAIRDAAVKHKRVFQTGTQQRSDARFRQACALAQGRSPGQGPHHRGGRAGRRRHRQAAPGTRARWLRLRACGPAPPRCIRST